MDSFRIIILYYMQNKRRFQIENILEKQQIKLQLLSILQQIERFFNGGLTPKQTMRVINKVQDQSLNDGFNTHNVDFKHIKQKIKQYDIKQKDDMMFIRKLEIFQMLWMVS